MMLVSSAPWNELILALILTFLRIYIIAGLVLILSVCDNYLGKASIMPIPPTAFALLFMISLVVEVLINDLYSKQKLTLVTTIAKNNSLIIGAFFLLVFFSLLGAMHPTAYWSQNGTWIYLNSYNFIIFVLAMLMPCIPFIRSNFRLISILSLSLALWAVASDVMTPGTFAVEINRPSGFSGNANWGALSLVFLTVGSLSFNARSGLISDLLILLCAAWGITNTLSRSGTINFVILFILYVYLTFFTANGNVRRGTLLVTALVGLLFVFIVYTLANDSSDRVKIGNHSQSRLSGFLKGEIVDDGSSSSRKGAALHAIELIDDAPIFGHGTGYSRNMPEKPHNMFLNQGVNNGFLGIFAYLLLILVSLWHFLRYRYYRGIALISVMFIGSFFSHNILEQRTFLLLLGYTSTMAWMKGGRV